MMDVLVKGERVTVTDKEAYELRQRAFEMAKPFLDKISSPVMKKFADLLWINAPEYFFVIPASSSGKYHGEWATSLGGLVRHVLTGVQAVDDLSRTFGLSDDETDTALVAIFGHDCLKYGIDYDERYFDMHPFLPRSYYGHKDSVAFLGNDFIRNELGYSRFDEVMTGIERHMGNIESGTWTSVGRVRPETKVEQVIHLADYMASRGKFVMTDYISGYALGGGKGE